MQNCSQQNASHTSLSVKFKERLVVAKHCSNQAVSPTCDAIRISSSSLRCRSDFLDSFDLLASFIRFALLICGGVITVGAFSSMVDSNPNDAYFR